MGHLENLALSTFFSRSNSSHWKTHWIIL
jgi:hypothetical protein